VPFAVENLKVYQKAIDFADEALATSEHFPRGYGFLADQLNRASVSIAANLAEGNGRFTRPDRRHFFGIARGSILECLPLLELTHRRGLIDAGRHERLRAALEELGRMISGLINGAHGRQT
jgi:four helix bundle protein